MDATPWRDVLVTRFSALRHRNFRLYVGGQIISLTGTWMQTVAQGWLMHRLTDSAFWLGLLGFTQFLPVMLLSLWAGAVIDRMDKRRLLCLTQGAFLLQATLLALVVTTGVVRPWMVLALAGVFGMVNAFDMPTRHSFVVEMTSREDIGNAIAINSAVFNSARIVGPAVAGILLATVGEGGCFWLNALSYVAVLVCLARMDLPRREFCRRGASLGAGLAEGVRYAWRTRALRNLLLLLGITAGIGFQYQLLLPVYARVVLHAGPKVYGLLLTAFGAGALVGALRLTGRPGRPGLRFNLMLGLGACAVGLGVFAWSRLIPLSLVAGALDAAEATLLVAAEISEVEGRGGEVNVLLSLATAVDEVWLKELFPADYYEARGVVYDEAAKRVVARRERRFRDLVLEAKGNSDDVPSSEAAALLTAEVLAGRIQIEAWDEGVEQWIVRVNRLAEWFPELEVNPLTEADRATLIEQICYGETSARGVREKPVMPILRDWLTAEQLAVIDDYLPERLTMANGRRSRITYHKEGPPVLSARIQELYGVEGRFTLGHGRVPVKIEVLAPNQRPIQVTDDLTSFWRDMYPGVKAELSRRYPRHEWR